MNESNTWGWIGGIVVLLVVVGGIWWWLGQSGSSPTQANTEQTATTTAATAGQVTVTDEGSDTVASIVAGLSDGTEFASLASSTGVLSLLDYKGPYTVFVSTNEGYGLLAPGTISDMTAAQQTRMMEYAVVSGRALDIDATNSGEIKALSGDMLNFQVQSNGYVEINSSFALQEYKASNGIVYVINQPLLPPASSATP